MKAGTIRPWFFAGTSERRCRVNDAASAICFSLLPPNQFPEKEARELAAAGALPVVDIAYSEAASRQALLASVPSDLGVGVVIAPDLSAQELSRLNIRAVIIPVDWELDESADLTAFIAPFRNYPVWVEVTSQAAWNRAAKANPTGLILKGFESGGVVGEESTYILLQRYDGTLPVLARGGIGPDTAAAAVAGGASGVVLDVQTWGTLPLAAEAKAALLSLQGTDAVTLRLTDRHVIRVAGKMGAKSMRTLRQAEEAMLVATAGDKTEQALKTRTERAEQLYRELQKISVSSFSAVSDKVFPVGQETGWAKLYADRYQTAAGIVTVVRDTMKSSLSKAVQNFPWRADSPFAKSVGAKLPIFQGPMAQTSDVAAFAGKIMDHGIVANLALGNMPGNVCEKLIKDTLALSNGRPFGGGIIGLEANAFFRDQHIAHMKTLHPPLAVVAAGTTEQALDLTAAGIRSFLHTPVHTLLVNAMDQGHLDFILEGTEAGGHIGKLTSFVLWQSVVQALADKPATAGKTANVVLAGGFGNVKGAVIAAALVARAQAAGHNFGIQMGTAFLFTKEAVETGATSPMYQRVLVDLDRTETIGDTVMTPARMAPTAKLFAIREHEYERIKAGESLDHRKHLYENDNLGGLRAASKKQRIEKKPEGGVRFVDLDDSEQMNAGLFHVGMCAALRREITTIQEVLNDNTVRAEAALKARVAELTAPKAAIPKPAAPAVSVPVPQQAPSHVPSHAPSATGDEGIAIIGLGGVFPDANNIQEFWRNITSGKYSIREVPEGRWSKEFFYSDDRNAPDKSYSKIGGFINDPEFDSKSFRIPPSVASSMDLAQRVSLVAVREALQDAGYFNGKPFDKGRCAVIVGNSQGGENTHRYAYRLALPMILAKLEKDPQWASLPPPQRRQITDNISKQFLGDLPEITGGSMPGELPNVIAGRIANVFDLSGPNFVCDAACAASLAAVHTSVLGLMAGEFDMVVTGGVDRGMDADSYIKFCKVGALSSEISAPFDKRASGFVMGEGAGFLVMKRLSDAVRDGDKVYAVLRGVGASSDGAGRGITAPSPAGQRKAIERTYRMAKNVDPRTITLVECHGTSTPLGDATETTVLKEWFNEHGSQPHSVAVGSVKSQIGHLKSAAGAAGLIKMTLALHNKTLPPSINFESPADGTGLGEGSPLFVNTKARPWNPPAGMPRRAAVSAFGFGGTNFHVVVEEYNPASGGSAYIPKDAGHMTIPVSSTVAVAAPAAAAPVASAPVQAAAATISAATTVDKTAIETAVIEVLADQTGYEKEDLGRTLDLEADLGIDTVKQAEVFAALRERYSLEKDPNLKLRDYPTVEKIVDYLASRLAGTGTVTAAPVVSAPAVSTPSVSALKVTAEPAPAHAAPVAAPATAKAVDKAAIEQKVIEVLADQTGYEKEDLGRTLDLEADLGIDTVKQAEVFAALRESYSLEKDPNLKLRDYPTIEKIVDYLALRLTSGAPVVAAAPVAAAQAPVSAENAQKTNGELHADVPSYVVVLGSDQGSLAANLEAYAKAPQGVRFGSGSKYAAFGFINKADASKRAVQIAEAVRAGKRPSPALNAKVGDARKQKPRVAFVYPGQGSQYVGMLQELMIYPEVRATFEEAESVVSPLIGRSLLGIIHPKDTSEENLRRCENELKQTEITQPAVLTADVAIHRFLAARGFKPDAVAGHSLGEYGAAVAAGVMSFHDALEAVAARGREMANVKVDDNGLMLMVPMGQQDVEPLLGNISGYIAVANRNSPQQTVIGGASASVQAFKKLLDGKGVDTVLLNVSHAFHSKIVAPASEPLRRVLDRLGIKAPELPIYSNVTAEPYPMGPNAHAEIIDLLSRQIAASVDWIGSVEHMYRDGIEVYVECGPKRALAGLVEANLKGRPSVAIQTCHPKRGEALSLVEALAHLSAELVVENTPAPAVAVPVAKPVTQPISVAGGNGVYAPLSAPVSASPSVSGDNPLARWANDPRFGFFWQKNGRAIENMIAHMWAVTMEETPVRPEPAQPAATKKFQLAATMPALSDDIHKPSSDPNRNAPMQLWSAASPISRRVPVYVSEAKPAPETRSLSGKTVAFWSVSKQSETLAQALQARGAKVLAPAVFGSPFTGADVLVIDSRAGSRSPDRFVGDLALRLNDLVAVAKAAPANFTLIGVGAHNVDLDPSQAMFQAAVRGFVLTLGHEFPQWKVRWTMATTLDDAQLARAIDIDAGSPETVIQSRWSRFGRAMLEGVPASIQGNNGLKARKDRVWLVTGGARGITREIVLDLARNMGGRFALVGSSPAPAGPVELMDEKEIRKQIRQAAKTQGLQPSAADIESEVRKRLGAAEIQKALSALRDLGAETRYYACDLAQPEAVKQLLKSVRNDFGTVNVVIHGAGREFSRSTSEKTMDDIKATLGVKLEGALALAIETRADPLEAFVMFGSVVGRFGNKGQADYAAANGALTGLVRHFSAVGNPAARPLLFDWSAWAEVGMASRGVAKDHFKESGVDLIYPSTGAPLVRAELMAGTAGEILACGSLGELDRSGVIKPPPSLPVAPKARNFTFSAQTEPWLADHSIQGTPVWPGVGGIELMRQEAGFAGKPFEATDLRFERAIKVFAGKSAEIQATRETVDVRVPSPNGPEFKPHFRAGHFSVPSVKPEWSAPRSAAPSTSVREAIYQVYFHGPRFQVMTGGIEKSGRDWVFGGQASPVFSGGSALKAADTTASAIEAAFQAAGLRTMIETGTSVLPSGIQWLVVHRPVNGDEPLAISVTPVSHPSEAIYRCNVRVFDQTGNELLSLVGYDQVVTGQNVTLPGPLAALKDTEAAASNTGAAPAVIAGAPVAATATVNRDEVYARILDVLCRETGYEAGDITPTADLEGDLGIDTVKQAEVFAQVRASYGLEKDPNFKLRDYPTMNRLVDYVAGRLQSASTTAGAATAEAPVAAGTKAPELQAAEFPPPVCPFNEPWSRFAVLDIGTVLSDLDRDPNRILGELSADERGDYATMTYEKRRLDWLAGRLAARRALRAFGVDAPVVVKADESGEPRFTGPLGDKYGLTISHSNIWATAIVWERKGQLGEDRHLGVDIERIGDRTEAFLEDNFSDDERRALPAGQDRSTAATTVWSLKEASLKALGTGLRLRPDQVVVTLDHSKGAAKVRLTGEAETLRLQKKLAEFTGRFARTGEYVLTVIESPKLPPAGFSAEAAQGWSIGLTLNAKNKS